MIKHGLFRSHSTESRLNTQFLFLYLSWIENTNKTTQNRNERIFLLWNRLDIILSIHLHKHFNVDLISWFIEYRIPTCAIQKNKNCLFYFLSRFIGTFFSRFVLIKRCKIRMFVANSRCYSLEWSYWTWFLLWIPMHRFNMFARSGWLRAAFKRNMIIMWCLCCFCPTPRKKCPAYTPLFCIVKLNSFTRIMQDFCSILSVLLLKMSGWRAIACSGTVNNFSEQNWLISMER